MELDKDHVFDAGFDFMLETGRGYIQTMRPRNTRDQAQALRAGRLGLPNRLRKAALHCLTLIVHGHIDSPHGPCRV